MTVAGTTNFSDKEKDEASPSRLCGRDSSNAFILRFAGGEGVFVFRIVLVLVLVLDFSWAGDENEEEDESEGEFISALVSQLLTHSVRKARNH